MGAIGKKLRSLEGGRIAFRCPGCESHHHVTVDGSRGWTWNGDVDKPTFSPSVLVRSGHYIPNHTGKCWCTPPEDGEDWGFKCECCHSFVIDGNIQFLSDCSHELAGQTVPLPDFYL